MEKLRNFQFKENLEKGLKIVFDKYQTKPDDELSRALDGLFHLVRFITLFTR